MKYVYLPLTFSFKIFNKPNNVWKIYTLTRKHMQCVSNAYQKSIHFSIDICKENDTRKSQ